MDPTSHKDCIPREDYTALMAIMNHTRQNNAILAREVQALQGRVQTLQALLAEESAAALLPREEVEPTND